jgi:hypothetical protein
VICFYMMSDIRGLGSSTLTPALSPQRLCRNVIAKERSDEAISDVLEKIEIAALPSVAPNEQRQFTEGKIPLYPPFPKGEVLHPPLKKEGWGGF